MAGERLADLAVTSLAAYLRESLPATLRAVELELGLPVGELADPEAVVEAELPGDKRSPLIEVFDADGICDQTLGSGVEVWDISCDVVIGYTGDARLETSEQKLRRYATALVRCLKESRTLGGRVPFQLGLTRYQPSAGKRGESIRYEATLGVVLRLIDQ